MEITIDTNILKKANENDWNCIDVLSCLRRNLNSQLVLDHEGGIKEEYKKHIIWGTPSYVWFHEYMNYKKCAFYSGKRTKRLETDLDKINFHKNDRKFIGVAIRSKDKIIISEDTRSFLKDEFKDEIALKYDLGIYNAEDFLKKDCD